MKVECRDEHRKPLSSFWGSGVNFGGGNKIFELKFSLLSSLNQTAI